MGLRLLRKGRDSAASRVPEGRSEAVSRSREEVENWNLLSLRGQRATAEMMLTGS